MDDKHIHEHDVQHVLGSFTQGKNLDFSQFHPSDHWPFSLRCWSLYPIGWRSGFYHMKIAWTYHRRDQALTPLYWMILCRINRHAWQTWYITKIDTHQTKCYYCRKERETTSEERFNAPY